jgi:ATP-dependent protease ClpP protease subunit
MLKKLIVAVLVTCLPIAQATQKKTDLMVITGEENLIIYKDKIGMPIVHDKLLEELTMAPPNPILWLETDGGSILEGVKIIDIIERRGDVTCVSPHAASMGFAIMQACKERIVTGGLPLWMIHAPQVTLQGQKSLTELIDIMEQFLIPMEKKMTKLIAGRMKLTEKAFREKIKNDWFLIGTDVILANSAADRSVKVTCTESAKKKTREKIVVKVGMFGPQVEQVKVQLCPLLDIPVR